MESITYQNPENGYTVARLAPGQAEAETAAAHGDDRVVTLAGTLPDLTSSEAIVTHGWWQNDPKHSWLFRAAEDRSTLPAMLQGMKKCLGGGLFNGRRSLMSPGSGWTAASPAKLCSAWLPRRETRRPFRAGQCPL